MLELFFSHFLLEFMSWNLFCVPKIIIQPYAELTDNSFSSGPVKIASSVMDYRIFINKNK